MEGILKDKEIDEIVDVLEKNKPEEVEKLNEISNIDNTKENIEEGIGCVTIDPQSGVQSGLVSADIPLYEINKDKSITDLINKDSDEESLKKAILNTSKDASISDEATYKILNIILKLKNGENIPNLYNELPEEIKTQVQKLAIESGISTNNMAKMVMETFISQVNIDKEIIDFQTAMNNTLDIPDILDMYTEHIRDTMEIKTLESADRLEEGGEKDKANLLRQVSKAFTDSYTFTSLLNFLYTDKKAKKRIDKDVKDYKNFCWSFDYNNQNSRFAINSSYDILPTLERLFEEDESITSDDIKKFVILFCKRCEGLNCNDVVDAAYMYYSIKNIITLNYIEELKTDFSKTILNNVKSVILAILEEEENHNERAIKRGRKYSC